MTTTPARLVKFDNGHVLIWDWTTRTAILQLAVDEGPQCGTTAIWLAKDDLLRLALEIQLHAGAMV